MSSDLVVELDLPWLPDPGAPGPVLYQDEGRAMLVYNTSTLAPGGPLAVVQFDHCLVAMFGYPNDDGRWGHPLYEAGLTSYALFEVANSSWLERLRVQNAIAHPEAASWWPNSPHTRRDIGPVRHFVVTFHDSTFECLASSITGEFAEQPPRMTRT